MKVIASRRGFDRARKRIQADPPLIGQERRITLTKLPRTPAELLWRLPLHPGAVGHRKCKGSGL
jgi:hypothetical protein